MTTSSGLIYLGDSPVFCVRKVAVDGTVSVLAGGDMTTHTDGEGTQAGFPHPSGMALDAAGNLIVNDHLFIRKVTPSGTVTTVGAITGHQAPIIGVFPTQPSSGLSGLTILPNGTIYFVSLSENQIESFTSSTP